MRKLQAFQLVVCENDGYNTEDNEVGKTLKKGMLYVLQQVCGCGECGLCNVIGDPTPYHVSRFRAAQVKDEILFKYKPVEERLDVIRS